jgi:hypothetical protein
MAAADPAEVLDAITADQLAARRVRAFGLLLQAARLQDQADEEFILCDLADQVPAARAELDAAVKARQAAEATPKKGEGHLAALRARRDRLTERAAEAAKAIEVEDLDGYLASDPDAAVAARRDRLAVDEELAEVKARIGAVSNLLSAPLAVLRDARAAETQARAAWEAILEAALDPLAARRAEGTDGFRQRMNRLFPEILTIPGHPDTVPAVEALMRCLAASGVGAEVETRAIEAYAAGNPAARAIGTGTKTLPSGQTVITEPGKPPVVYQGRATPGQLATAPGLPQGDGRTAAQVMSDMWANAGYTHAPQPGLPGIHHGTGPV